MEGLRAGKVAGVHAAAAALAPQPRCINRSHPSITPAPPVGITTQWQSQTHHHPPPRAASSPSLGRSSHSSHPSFTSSLSHAQQLGESLEEQLGQRLLRMPPPVVPDRHRSSQLGGSEPTATLGPIGGSPPPSGPASAPGWGRLPEEPPPVAFVSGGGYVSGGGGLGPAAWNVCGPGGPAGSPAPDDWEIDISQLHIDSKVAAGAWVSGGGAFGGGGGAVGGGRDNDWDGREGGKRQQEGMREGQGAAKGQGEQLPFVRLGLAGVRSCDSQSAALPCIKSTKPCST